MEPPLDVGQDSLEGDPASRGSRLVVDQDAADVHGSVGGFEVEERRVEPAQLLHGFASSARHQTPDTGRVSSPRALLSLEPWGGTNRIIRCLRRAHVKRADEFLTVEEIRGPTAELSVVDRTRVKRETRLLPTCLDS